MTGSNFPPGLRWLAGQRNNCFIEFGTSKPRYFVPEARQYRVSIEALLGHRNEWHPVVTFTWHADRLVHPSNYIAYRNTAEAVEGDGPEAAEMALNAVAAEVVAQGFKPDGRKLEAA